MQRAVVALLAGVVSVAQAQSGVRDARLAPGVPHVLATQRAATIRDVRYTLTLNLTHADSAPGAVTVRFSQQRAQDVILDFRGTAVSGLRANGVELPVTASTWNRAHILVPASAVRAGENEVQVLFTAPIAAAGASIIRSRDASDGQDYLYTLLVPSDANLLFPCFDQPDLKARVTLRIEAPRAWGVLANGAATRVDTTERTLRHQFAETQPISTYLIAFAAGPYATVTQARALARGAPPTPVTMWARASRMKEAESDSLIAMNTDALQWLGDWFGVPYPFGKFDFLLAPVFPFGGMEHPGAVFYNEQSFIYRERPTASQLLGRQATVFHEVAHQWFGDYVTMQWFDDLWLKEGFATYMAAKMQAAIAPESNPWKTFYLRNKPVAYGTDATAGTTPVWQQLGNLEQAKSNYGPIVYNKAPGVLRQLDYLVGDTAFQRGVRAFLREHPYGNATWRDLLGAVSRASGRDLTVFGQQWILRPGMPIITQQLRTANGRITRLALTQRAAQPQLSGSAPWPMRTSVLLYYTDAPPVRIPVEITTTVTEVTAARGLPAPAFVFANEGDYGYAIILPDSASTTWLLGHVGEVKDDMLRAMLWGALWDQVREATLSPAAFAVAALDALPGERDEQIAGALTNRLLTATLRYGQGVLPAAGTGLVEQRLLAGARDTSRSYGQRKAQLDALIGSSHRFARRALLDSLNHWLDGDSAAGLPLRAPTRWAIITSLTAARHPSAAARLQAETRRDSSSEGKRQAFAAAAAAPDSATKAQYFARWFGDSTLNEEWVTASLRAFHDDGQDVITRRYLVPSLDTLPWVQKNRRIFFLGAWLSAAIGGQSSPQALAAVDAWLQANPRLGADLRRKVLQARDELERTVRIRQAYPVRASRQRHSS
jgi:aminopeptidase N